MMLHQDVAMTDIDVDQWRNAQAMLLRSAKACRRLVVIHDHGRVVKFRHTQAIPVHGRTATVEDPHRLARELYEVNRDVVDFVVVMEREAVDAYFARIQDAWDIEDDLDDFVQKTYAALDLYPDGIVTHPGPARRTLGLQWRLGVSLAQLRSAVRDNVEPGTTVILGVESDGALWTSLVLDFDDDHKITSVTTADPWLVDIRGSHDELVDRLTAWVESSGRVVSVALVLDHGAAVELLAAAAGDKVETLRRQLSEKRCTLLSENTRGELRV